MVTRRSTVPDILYHYTSIEAFKSIIETKKMRATRYDQMNDTGELQLGVRNLLEAVNGHRGGGSPAVFEDWLVSEIQEFGRGTLDVYVLSLSAVADSLDQWRAYSRNGGVAIGFDSAKVQKGFLIDITRKAGGLRVPNPIRPDGLSKRTDAVPIHGQGRAFGPKHVDHHCRFLLQRSVSCGLYEPAALRSRYSLSVTLGQDISDDLFNQARRIFV